MYVCMCVFVCACACSRVITELCKPNQHRIFVNKEKCVIGTLVVIRISIVVGQIKAYHTLQLLLKTSYLSTMELNPCLDWRSEPLKHWGKAIIFLTERRPLERSRWRWEDNIRICLKEIGINTRNWFDSAQDRDYWRALVNSTLNLRVS